MSAERGKIANDISVSDLDLVRRVVTVLKRKNPMPLLVFATLNFLRLFFYEEMYEAFKTT